MYISPTRWTISVGSVVSCHELDAPTRPLLTVCISLTCEVLPRVSAKTAGLAHPEKFHRPKTVVVVATESGDCLRLFISALVPLLLPLLRWGAVVSGGLVLLVLRSLSMVRRALEIILIFLRSFIVAACSHISQLCSTTGRAREAHSSYPADQPRMTTRLIILPIVRGSASHTTCPCQSTDD